MKELRTQIVESDRGAYRGNTRIEIKGKRVKNFTNDKLESDTTTLAIHVLPQYGSEATPAILEGITIDELKKLSVVIENLLQFDEPIAAPGNLTAKEASDEGIL